MRNAAIGWRGITAAVAMTGLVVGVGWSGRSFLDSAGQSSRPAPPPQAEAGPPPAPPVCGPGEECLEVASNQWVGVKRGTGTKGFVVLDAGGPGQANHDTTAIEASLPEALRGRTIVKLYEPWLDDHSLGSCHEELAAVSWSATGRIGDTCAESVGTLAQAEPRSVVEAVAVLLGEEPAGLVTFSFGSTRTRRLWSLLGDDGILLSVQPDPSPATGIDDVVAARAQAAWSVLREVHAQVCDRGADCPGLAELRATLLDDEVDRQRQLSGPELSLFVVGAAADLDTYRPYLVKLVSGESFSQDDLDRTELAALDATHSSGPFHAPASNAGYRAGMCQAYGEPATLIPAQASGDPLERALRAQVGACPSDLTRYTAEPAHAPARACVLTTDTDPVLPPGLQDTAQAFTTAQRVSYDADTHTWPADVTARLAITTDGCSLQP